MGLFYCFKIFIDMSKELIKKLLRESLVDESNIVDIDKLLPDVDKITNSKILPIVNILYKAIKKAKANRYSDLSTDEKVYLNAVFKGMVNIRSKEFKTDYSTPSEDPTTVDDLTNTYNLKTLTGEETSVGVGFNYDPNDNAVAAFHSEYNWIVINMANIRPDSINEIKSTIRHELVHAVDPKVLNPELFYKKNNSDVYDKQKYHKELYEFDAYSHEIINNIVKNLNKLKKYDEKYIDSAIKSIWDIVDSIPENGDDVVYDKFQGQLVTRLFSENGITLRSNTTINSNFKSTLTILNSWATKPTMYKRFKQRLVRHVPYKK